MSLFTELKNKSTLEDLVKAAEQDTQKATYKDDRMWKPTIENGISFAVIRFLPVQDGSKPYTSFYTHSFQNPVSGRWFIDNCPTSIGRNDCPVCRANTVLWNTGQAEKKQLASSRKRNIRYVSNIYVIEDPKNPEAVGKVFLYTYGPTIFSMLKNCWNPVFDEGKAPFDPFNMWTGANFRMKIKPVKKRPNYDSSVLDANGPLADDKTLERIFQETYSLEEFTDPSRFKSSDELLKKFNDVVNTVVEETAESVEPPSSPDSSSKYNKFLKHLDDEDEDDNPF